MCGIKNNQGERRMIFERSGEQRQKIIVFITFAIITASKVLKKPKNAQILEICNGLIVKCQR
jgi:hypothetical protein